MGLDLNEIANDIATCVAYAGEHEIKVSYRPALITQKKIGAIQSSGGDDDFVNFLIELLVDWDITRGKKKVTLDEEGIKSVPISILKAIFFAVMQEGVDASGEAAKS